MTTKRERPHIILPSGSFRNREAFTPHRRGGGGELQPPPGGRPGHATLLRAGFNSATSQAKTRRSAVGIFVDGARPGIYLEFESFPNRDLEVHSLGNARAKDPNRHVEVVAVSSEVEGARRTTRATVFVPEGGLSHFLKQLDKYALTTPKRYRERRHEKVYDPIASVRLAALRDLWTDDAAAYPESEDTPIWWEVWLRRSDAGELQRLHDFAGQAKIRLGERQIQFDDRIVTLAKASPRALAASLDVLHDIAELRRAKETAAFFVDQLSTDQAEWTLDLAKRTQHAGPDAPSVCILDTGVNAGHPLLRGALTLQDCHAYDPSWGVQDDGGGREMEGHGTQMAGLALYGDLVSQLEAAASVVLGHRLESVKILPPTGQNEPDLYGAITAEAASRPEIQAPTRRRVFSMAVTARNGRDRGQPTSWSAAVDALAAGRVFDPIDQGLKYLDDHEDAPRRLFVVSAGNVERQDLERDHLSRSDVEEVHDPAQAWNALTVGAFTDKVVVSDVEWTGWSPVAKRGDLSPWSTTSKLFQPAWPMKPDIVLEGGNIVHNGGDEVDFPCADLSLLTTWYMPHDKTLVVSSGTSAATAQAARFCAIIAAESPEAWPETIRALVVHSAEWTDAMRTHLDAARGKGGRAQLVRRYGFGVPSLQRALLSAANAVTLVAQDLIHPFDDGKMREIHLHALPWPREVLAELGEQEVRVRVTLSYFVEPNPGRRGWGRKHRYQSHGLRFELKAPAESDDEFRKRLNKRALAEEEERPVSAADNDGWYLGPKARNRGSIHSDTLLGSGADIAERGLVAVYPVTGWWKELKKRDRSEHGARYALVVSIETDSVQTDLYTPIKAAIAAMVPTEV